MGLGDIFDAIFRVYRQHFLTFVGIAALLQVPLMLVQIGLLALGLQPTADPSELLEGVPADPSQGLGALSPGTLLVFFGVTIVMTILQSLIIVPLINGALTNGVAQHYRDQHVGILEAYGFGVDRMIYLVLATLLMGVIWTVVLIVPIGLLMGMFFIVGVSAGGGDAGVGMGIVFFLLIFLSALLLIALSVFLTVCFLFVVPAVVLEGQNPIDALRRSWELALSSFWRVLGIYLLLTLLVFVLTLVPAGALSFVIGIVFSDPSEIIIQQSLSNLVSYSMQILVLPLSVIGITVLYYDLRVRKEGEDLQMMAQSYELPNTP
jgi:hypothetical protein